VPKRTPTIRPPQQERSRASFERVLDAGARLLEEEGYEAFTLGEVSRRAKASIGSIYGRVKRKDDLIHAIHLRLMDEMEAEAATAIAASEAERLPTHELIAEAVREFADSTRRHARLLSVFMHRAAVDAAIAAAGSAASRRVGRRFEDLILARRDEIVQPDPERAVDVAFRMVYCTLTRQIMYGPTFESDRAIGWDDLVDQLTVACTFYLLGQSRSDAS